MVFEAGFQINFVIAFAIVLCHLDSPIRGPWDIRVLDLFIHNDIQCYRDAAAAAFSLGFR